MEGSLAASSTPFSFGYHSDQQLNRRSPEYELETSHPRSHGRSRAGFGLGWRSNHDATTDHHATYQRTTDHRTTNHHPTDHHSAEHHGIISRFDRCLLFYRFKW